MAVRQRYPPPDVPPRRKAGVFPSPPGRESNFSLCRRQLPNSAGSGTSALPAMEYFAYQLGQKQMYISSMNMNLSDPGVAATASGMLVLLFGKRWYLVSAAIPLVVLGLAWTIFGS